MYLPQTFTTTITIGKFSIILGTTYPNQDPITLCSDCGREYFGKHCVQSYDALQIGLIITGCGVERSLKGVENIL